MSKINAINKIGSNFKVHILKIQTYYRGLSYFENYFFRINLFSKIDRSLHEKLLISVLNRAKQMLK
jgi:hypothetical protein